MKIINNLNTSAVLNAIKYPFRKIASLFHRVTLANRIQTMKNPMYLSSTDALIPAEKSNPHARERSISTITIDENDYQDIDAFRENFISDSEIGKNTPQNLFKEVNPNHLYTRMNKRGDGEIERYLPSNENALSIENTKGAKNKKGQIHPFLKETKEVEIDPPAVPPKNKMLIQEVLKRDASYIKFPKALTEMPLTILKGSELFI